MQIPVVSMTVAELKRIALLDHADLQGFPLFAY